MDLTENLRILTKSRRLQTLVFLFFAAWGGLRADALVVTQAMKASTILEIHIEKNTIRAELEIGLEDLEAFRNLLPDPIYERLGYPAGPLAGRLERFFREGLVLRTENRTPLIPKIEEMVGRERVRRDEITGEPLPVDGEESQTVLFVRLVYPLRRTPRVLSISPPSQENGAVSAGIGFVVYHQGLPVNDFRYLSREETLRLDWTDPWYSEFDNRNLRRQFSGPISAFLYIEPYEVRQEIVVRPRDLQQWVDLGLEGSEVVPVAIQEQIKQKAVDFLGQHNPVTIDGKVVEGRLDRVHFIYRNLKTSGVIDPPRELDALSATLGVIFYYPTDRLPQEVTLEWELFNDRIQQVSAVATDEAGGLPMTLTREDPVLKWQNFLTNPTLPGLVEIKEPPGRMIRWIVILLSATVGVFALLFLASPRSKPEIWGFSRKAFRGFLIAVLAVALSAIFLALRPPTLSPAAAQSLVGGLLGNVYRAFDYRDESVIYDTLERSVSGELLTDIYLETRRSLELENQGGARAKVKEVQMLETKQTPLSDGSGFEARCTWNVSGSVGHWGHIHQRINQYQARFVVRAIGGVWKITELELLQETRL